MTSRTHNRKGEPKKTALVDGKNERQLRQERALERELARSDRGPFAQLSELDRRLGKGQGAARERARLVRKRAA